MSKPFPHKLVNDGICSRQVDSARRKAVAARDDLRSADVNEGDGLDVAGFEAYGSASSDIEALAIGLAAVEGEGTVRLDEMVVRADLRKPRS